MISACVFIMFLTIILTIDTNIDITCIFKCIVSFVGLFSVLLFCD